MARGPALTEQGRALASVSAPHVAALRDATAALGREAAEAFLPDYRAAGGTAYMVYPPAKPLSPKLVKFCAHLFEHVPRLAAQP